MADSKKYEMTVSAQTQYLEDQSDPASGRYVFGYTISIRNTGNIAAQLISRHWIITDADGDVQEVRGLGVVGHQPLLQPGEAFEYSSGSAIATPVGTMKGSYQMTAEDGCQFEAPSPNSPSPFPAFCTDCPVAFRFGFSFGSLERRPGEPWGRIR
jgi:ApaG protein